MKRNLKKMVVVLTLFLSILPTNLGAEGIKGVKKVDSIDSYVNNLVPTTRNEIIKDEDGQIYYLSMESKAEDSTMVISHVETENTSRKTFRKFYSTFKVFHHGYWDVVGKVHSSSNYYKKYTATGQPYYVWGKCAKGVYDYREDGFYVQNNHYEPRNTSAYQGQSFVRETGTWGSKYNVNSINAKFYAPKNM